MNVTGTSGTTLVVDTTTLVVDATNHRVGIGTAAPATGNTLDIVTTVTQAASTTRNINTALTHTLTGNSTTVMHAIASRANVNQASFNQTTTTGSVRGIDTGAFATGSSGTVTSTVGIAAGTGNTGAGTVTTAIAFYAPNSTNSGGGTLDTYIGFFQPSVTGGSTAGYGFRGSITAAATRWNLYMDGTAQNSIAGNLGLGFVTAPTNLLSLDGQSARTIGMERNTTAATAGLALNLQAGGSKSGGTDLAGGSLILSPGANTGTGRAYLSKMCYTTALSTGTTDGTQFLCGAEGVYLALSDASPVNVLTIAAANNTGNSVFIHYQVEVSDGASNHVQVEDGFVICRVINQNNSLSANTCTETSVQTLGSGTMTTVWAITAANPGVVSLNADTSLTPATGYPRLRYSAQVLGHQAMAIQ